MMKGIELMEADLDILRLLVGQVDTIEQMAAVGATVWQLRRLTAALSAATPLPILDPPVPAPLLSGGCFGGEAKAFTPLFVDPYLRESFYESDVLGGTGPDGPDRGNGRGLTYWFVGLSGTRRSVWAPRVIDDYAIREPSEETIRAALATVNGVRYLEVGPKRRRSRLSNTGLDSFCAVYEAGRAGWPAPGPDYMLIGLSETGLPIYARRTVARSLVQFVFHLPTVAP